MFDKMPPRNLFLITLAACLAVAGMWYTLRFKPRQDEIALLRTDVQTAQDKVTQYRTAQAQLPTLREEVAKLRVEQAEFLRALPNTANFGSVLNELRQTSGANGVNLTNVTVSTGAATGLPAGVRPIALTLNLNGKFRNVYRTIQSVETMGRFTNINSVALQLPQADSLDPDLESNLGLTVYTYDPNLAAVPADPNAAPAAPAAAPAAPAGGAQ